MPQTSHWIIVHPSHQASVQSKLKNNGATLTSRPIFLYVGMRAQRDCKGGPQHTTLHHYTKCHSKSHPTTPRHHNPPLTTFNITGLHRTASHHTAPNVVTKQQAALGHTTPHHTKLPHSSTKWKHATLRHNSASGHGTPAHHYRPHHCTPHSLQHYPTAPQRTPANHSTSHHAMWQHTTPQAPHNSSVPSRKPPRSKACQTGFRPSRKKAYPATSP